MQSSTSSHLNIGSKADSCLSKVCITEVFLNFVSSAMASSFSVTTSAENVFLMNFSRGFLKSTPSERFRGRFIHPAIFYQTANFTLLSSYYTCMSAWFFLPSDSREESWKLFLEVYSLSEPVSLGLTVVKVRGLRQLYQRGWEGRLHFSTKSFRARKLLDVQ